MKIKLKVFILLLCVQVGSAQSVIQDLKKINEQHKIHKTYQLKVDYKLYESHTSSVLQEAYKSTMYRKGDGLVTIIAGTIQARLGRVYIQLDSSEQKIFYAQRLKADAGLVFDLDSLMKYYETKSVNDPSNAVGKITMQPKANFKASELEKIELFYSRKDYVVFKTVSYYAQPMFSDKDGQPEPPPRLETYLGKYEVLSPKDYKYFLEDFYIKKSKDRLLPSIGFGKYEVIDGRIKK